VAKSYLINMKIPPFCKVFEVLRKVKRSVFTQFYLPISDWRKRLKAREIEIV
jgi:hypothetical protein